MKIWAHRGASADAPENTMEAFEMAANVGADGIELDVHLSADGHIIVMHDETVDRTTNGSGSITAMTLDELKKLDASCGRQGFAGARVPTLPEVFAFVKTTRMTVNVEIKPGVMPGEGIEAAVLGCAESFGMKERIIVSSFNHYVLEAVKKLSPATSVGALYQIPILRPGSYAKSCGFDAVHPQFRTLLIPGAFKNCRDASVCVNAWTVDDPKDIRRLMELGVDALITNMPALAMKAV